MNVINTIVGIQDVTEYCRQYMKLKFEATMKQNVVLV